MKGLGSAIIVLGSALTLTSQVVQVVLPTSRQAAGRWKRASHTHWGAIVMTTDTTEDGIQGTVTETITSRGDYREYLKRGFDQGEVVLSPTVHARKDWNGYVRELEGLELKRYITAAY